MSGKITMNLEELWYRLQTAIQDHIGEQQFEIWFASSPPFEFGEDWICFLVPNQPWGEHVQRSVWDKVAEFLLAQTGIQIEYRYILEHQQEPIRKKEAIRILEGIPEDKTFDNFVVGRCNEFAQTFSLMVANSKDSGN